MEEVKKAEKTEKLESSSLPKLNNQLFLSLKKILEDLNQVILKLELDLWNDMES